MPVGWSIGASSSHSAGSRRNTRKCTCTLPGRARGPYLNRRKIYQSNQHPVNVGARAAYLINRQVHSQVSEDG